jgi:signal transduction histidine kinase
MVSLRDRIGWRLRTPMSVRSRDAVAIAVAILAFAAGAVAFASGSSDSGIRFGYELAASGDTVVIVSEVMPWGTAAGTIQPGEVVISVNDTQLVPDFQMDVKPPAVAAGPGDLPSGPIWSVSTASPQEFANWQATGQVPVHLAYYSSSAWLLEESGSAPELGLAVLLLGGWWLRTGRAGEALRRLAIPAVVAIATPLFLVPLEFTSSAPGFIGVAMLLPLAQLPFGDGLAAEIDDADRRGRARLWVLALVALAVALGLLVLTGGLQSPPVLGQWIAVGAIAIVPAVMESGVGGASAVAADGTPAGRLTRSLVLVAAGMTPLVATVALVAPNAPPLTLPLVLWVLALVATQQFTVRPFARLATRATLQRDLVVAATEAERARIAADLHDVALQDLSMLVRRLDSRGDPEDAAAARRVVEQLRTITGELRLPILDDLGVGPALEWLVSRMDRLAGGAVRLERDDGSRLPPDVELAFFRVAQEALANAVKHGRAPIVVRYRVSPSGATLTVDDAGPGIEPGAAEAATAAGHFGLLGMQQRAEQIGAVLDVRRWPAGGTHVALDWRPG